MSDVFTGRSHVEIAEDLLITTSTPEFNLSKDESVEFQHQRRELGKEFRVQAERLIERWKATPEQISSARKLFNGKALAIFRRK